MPPYRNRAFEEAQSIAKALGVDFKELGPVEKEKVNWFDADAFVPTQYVELRHVKSWMIKS